MVQSALFTQIQYPEVRTIDSVDHGKEVSPLAVEILSHFYLVAIGSENYDFSTQYRVVSFPIYLLSREGSKVKAKIGVLEIKTADLVSAYDGQVLDPNRLGEPLWFSFVNEAFLSRSDTQLDPQSRLLVSEVPEEGVGMSDSDETLLEKSEEGVPDEALDLQKPTVPSTSQAQKQQQAKTAELEDLFTQDWEFQLPIALPEETENEDRESRKAYQKSASNHWIENFMKNNHYAIVDNEGGGDCFFAVIRDAFKSIGKKTSVAKLRAELAKHATAQVYDQYRELFFNYQGEIENLTKQQKQIAKAHKDLGTMAKKSADLNEQKRLVEEGKAMKVQFDQLKNQLREIRELLKEVEFMKGVDSLEKLRRVIQTTEYWADTWAIGVLEKSLNIKVVLFSEESFHDGATTNVLLCGQLNEEIASFSPQYYVLSSYSGNHYRLITYKHRSIFGFEEIPYGVKILIVNKCLERNAGAYYVIPAFREFKRELGIDADEGAPILFSTAAVVAIASEKTETEISIQEQADAYVQKSLDLNAEIVFQFHSNADVKKKPGKGSGERFPEIGSEKKSTVLRTDFTALAAIPQWRRKLDDGWMGVSKTETAASSTAEEAESSGVFQTPDGHRWASVEHYFHASKFRKTNADFYLKFALDTEGGKGGEFSRNLKLARLAAEPFGTVEKSALKSADQKTQEEAESLDQSYGIDLKPKKASKGGSKEYKRDAKIKIDPDFFGGRHLEERMLALRAKFTQNMDLGVLLKETKNAVLVQYHLGKEPVTDYALMRVRAELMITVTTVG